MTDSFRAALDVLADSYLSVEPVEFARKAKPAAGQKSMFDDEPESAPPAKSGWDETKVSREKSAHDQKRPGEFAPKSRKNDGASVDSVESTDAPSVMYPSLAESEPAAAPNGHWYGMTNRPPAIGAIPKGEYQHQPHNSFRHGQISYGRQLTEKEQHDYELTPIRHDSEIPDVARGVAAEMRDHVGAYLEPGNEDILSDKLKQSDMRKILGHVDHAKVIDELRKQHGRSAGGDAFDRFNKEASAIADLQAKIKRDAMTPPYSPPVTDAEKEMHKTGNDHMLTHGRFVAAVRATERGGFDDGKHSREMHRQYVQSAVDAGATVPDEVLSEYPGMTPKHASPDSESSPSVAAQSETAVGKPASDVREGATKEPWEMTKDDFVRDEMRKIGWGGGKPKKTEFTGRHRDTSQEMFDLDAIVGRHASSVENAITEGKIGSHADYPNLGMNAEPSIPADIAEKYPSLADSDFPATKQPEAVKQPWGMTNEESRQQAEGRIVAFLQKKKEPIPDGATPFQTLVSMKRPGPEGRALMDAFAVAKKSEKSNPSGKTAGMKIDKLLENYPSLSNSGSGPVSKSGKQEEAEKPFKPEAIPGQQMGLFGEESGGQKQLFNVVKPKKGDKPQSVAPSTLEKIGDEIDARQAERTPLAGQKAIEDQYPSLKDPDAAPRPAVTPENAYGNALDSIQSHPEHAAPGLLPSPDDEKRQADIRSTKAGIERAQAMLPDSEGKERKNLEKNLASMQERLKSLGGESGQSKPAPLGMDGKTREQRKAGPAAPPLPQKSIDMMDAAIASKDVAKLKKMVDPANKGWRSQFEAATGLKLPKTMRDTHSLVEMWAGPGKIFGDESDKNTSTEPEPQGNPSTDPLAKYPSLAEPGEQPSLNTAGEGFPFDMEAARVGMEKRGYAQHGDHKVKVVPHQNGGIGDDATYAVEHYLSDGKGGANRTTLPEEHPSIEAAQAAAINHLSDKVSGKEPAEDAATFGQRFEKHLASGKNEFNALIHSLAEHLQAKGSSVTKDEINRNWHNHHVGALNRNSTDDQIKSVLEASVDPSKSPPDAWWLDQRPTTGPQHSAKQQDEATEHRRKNMAEHADHLDRQADVLTAVGSDKAAKLTEQAQNIRSKIVGNRSVYRQAIEQEEKSKADQAAAEAEQRKWKPEPTPAKPMTDKAIVKASGRYKDGYANMLLQTGWASEGHMAFKPPEKLKQKILEAYGEVDQTAQFPTMASQFADAERAGEAMKFIGSRTHPAEPKRKGFDATPESHSVLMADSKDRHHVVDARCIQTIRKAYPKATFHATTDEDGRHSGMVVAKNGSELVGLIMESEERGDYAKATDEHVQSLRDSGKFHQFSRDDECQPGSSCSPRTALIAAVHATLDHQGNHVDDTSVEDQIPEDPRSLDHEVAVVLHALAARSPAVLAALDGYLPG